MRTDADIPLTDLIRDGLLDKYSHDRPQRRTDHPLGDMLQFLISPFLVQFPRDLIIWVLFRTLN